MKLHITKSSIASAVSAFAIIVATHWDSVGPIFTQVKELPFFVEHPKYFSELVTVATIVMLFGQSIIQHRKPQETPQAGAVDTTNATLEGDRT